VPPYNYKVRRLHRSHDGDVCIKAKRLFIESFSTGAGIFGVPELSDVDGDDIETGESEHTLSNGPKTLRQKYHCPVVTCYKRCHERRSVANHLNAP
jgi:hypothetical protein